MFRRRSQCPGALKLSNRATEISLLCEHTGYISSMIEVYDAQYRLDIYVLALALG